MDYNPQHWSFDPAAYRASKHKLLLSSAMYGAAGCALVSIASFVLLCVAAGVN